MRSSSLTSAALALLAGSISAQAADVYAPGLGYGEAPPIYQPVPRIPEAPPPPYAQLPPPLAYPLPPQPFYPPAGYGPDPGWVYLGPPAVTYECWWDGLGQRVCARPGW